MRIKSAGPLSMLCIRLGVLLLAITQTRKSSQLNKTAQTLNAPRQSETIDRYSIYAETSVFIERIEYDIMASEYYWAYIRY